MAEGTKLIPAPLQQLGFAGVTPSVFINVAVFAQPCRLLLVQNLTDQILAFSYDASETHFILPSCGNLTLDCATNKGTPNTASIAQGNGIWVTSVDTLPTTGSVYVSFFYAG